ncbi:serine/threonine-protein kinase [Aquimonas voraii]|uniref:Serine/threonine protein kinase n=1 Tax=Aquimonas voraii TaxID=265719 RepID=A0A1G6U2H0_9GAMM|nr:serine/threonine-protein kinase [Aquimonas voraii]SDD35503.1 Serine/threonine protein kinase [Aquimonas voraii]
MTSSQRSLAELMRLADRHFDALVELSLAEREFSLRQLEAEDPELGGMLRRLLQAWEGGGLSGMATGAAARALPEPTELSMGFRFGAFAVLRALGRGGMGEVYLAERVEGGFDQRVAIKRIVGDGALAPERAAEYLGRERGLLARLQHPGIATLIDGGVDVDGFPWLAMEYIEGQTLAAYLESHAPGFPQRFDLLMQLIDAVMHAHRQLIAHGDLKPVNLMVQPDGRLRVLDFGIARLLSEAPSPATGGPATPGWASPEQRSGGVVGIASDQYQIARLALLLLAGDSQALAPGEPLGLAQRARAAGLAHARRLDSTLEAVLARALSLDPGQRYPDLSALRADLLAWREARPIAARAGQLRWQALSLLRRHPLSLGLAALLLVASSGFLWTLQQRNVELAQARDLAIAEAERARHALERRGRMLGFVERVFSLADPIGEGGLIQDIDVLLAAAADEVPRQFSQDPDLRHEARAMLGIVALRRGDQTLAQSIGHAAASDASPSPGSFAALQALTLEAELIESGGDHAGSAAAFARALDALPEAHAESDRWRLFLMIRRMEALRLSGQEAVARGLVSDVLELSERAEANAHERSDALAYAALLEPDPVRAYTLQRQAYETLAQVQSPDQPVMIKRLTNLAGTRMLMGDYAGATADYGEALGRVEAQGRLDAPYHATAQVVYGRVLTLQGRWQAAQPWLERPLRIFASEQGSALLSYAEGAWLAWAVEQPQMQDLEPRWQRWMRDYEGQVGRDHARVRAGALLGARLARRSGDFARAGARLRALESAVWKAGTPREEANFAAGFALERLGLALDLRGDDPALQAAACAQAEQIEAKSQADAEPLNPDLVSGRAARLDLALCAFLDGRGGRAQVEAARAALADLVGPGYWLLARRVP